MKLMGLVSDSNDGEIREEIKSKEMDDQAPEGLLSSIPIVSESIMDPPGGSGSGVNVVVRKTPDQDDQLDNK